MQKIIIISTLFLSLLTIFSCGIKLEKESIKSIPYKGNEILVFESDRNEKDTIFLKGISKFNACYDPLALFKPSCEGYKLNCKRSDPNYDRYFEYQELANIVSNSNGITYINFDIKLRYAWFYGKNNFELSEFHKMSNTKLIIGTKVYEDVKVIESNGSYNGRENYVERFYWSVSAGFLGVDQRDRKWRLTYVL